MTSLNKCILNRSLNNGFSEKLLDLSRTANEQVLQCAFLASENYLESYDHEIQKSRVSRAVLPFFPRAFPGLLKPRMKITFTKNCLKQHFN